MSKPHKAKIDLVIIGAEKAATTSLKHYLSEHPGLAVHPQMEFAYFLDDKEHSKDITAILNKYYTSPEHTTGKKIVAKSARLYSSEIALKRLHEHNPDCKIVLIVRNPVERAYSSYLMHGDVVDFKFTADEIKGFAHKTDDWRYIKYLDKGMYVNHLKSIFKYFPKQQVRLVLFEDLKTKGVEVCRSIFQWLAVDEKFAPDVHKKYNTTQKKKSSFYSKTLSKILEPHTVFRKVFNTVVPERLNYKVGDALRGLNKKDVKYPEIDNATIEYLKDFFRQYNKELEDLTGIDVSAWDK